MTGQTHADGAVTMAARSFIKRESLRHNPGRRTEYSSKYLSRCSLTFLYCPDCLPPNHLQRMLVELSTVRSPLAYHVAKTFIAWITL